MYDVVLKECIKLLPVITLTITSVISLLMLKCLYFTIRLSIDPEMIVYMTSRSGKGLMLLIIKNVGNGAAKDISFSLSRPIPPIPGMGSNKSYPVFDGLLELNPDDERVMVLGAGFEVLKKLGDDVISVTIKYSTKRKGLWGHKKHTTICFIDGKSFKGCADKSSISSRKGGN